MKYRNSSLKYLQSARARLNENSSESLIYAALDLRMSIEARLQQYTDANRWLTKTNKKEWKIAVLSKELENAFKQRDKIAEFSISILSEESPKYSLYYTPVSKSLQKMAGQLGNYLHYGKTTENTQLKQLLEKVASEIELANKGTLLGVPMLNRATGQLKMFVEAESKEHAEIFISVLNCKVEFMLHVNYHTAYPENAS